MVLGELLAALEEREDADDVERLLRSVGDKPASRVDIRIEAGDFAYSFD